MKRIIRTLIVIGLVGIMANCSEQEFSSVPSDACNEINAIYGEGSCTPDPITGLNQLSYSLNSCKTDILFVVDNSGSMYPEQQELATRFPGFLDALAEDDLDFQIAITTTDVSYSPNNPADVQNGNGTFWDGKLIPYSNGAKFITNSTPSAQSLFEGNVQRPETYGCDTGGKCPSGDERGVYGATLAVENAFGRGNVGANQFFRPDGHLAVVILSDENERSDGGNIFGYPTQSKDKPNTLVQTVKSTFGLTKVFSVHPIVVESGDSQCNSEQNSQQTGQSRPRYGTFYEALADPEGSLEHSDPDLRLDEMAGLVKGHTGSVCERNYTPVLEQIADSISRNVTTNKLACSPEGDLSVFADGVELETDEYYIDEENRLVLNIPPVCLIEVNYQCPRNI